MIFSSEAATWFHGFNVKKEDYPEPWATAKDLKFPASRSIEYGGKTARLGWTLANVLSLLFNPALQRHVYIGFDDINNNICVELLMPSGVYCGILNLTYDSLSAAYVEAAFTEDPIFQKVDIDMIPQRSATTLIYLLLMLRLIIKSKDIPPLPTGEVPRDRILSDLSFINQRIPETCPYKEIVTDSVCRCYIRDLAEVMYESSKGGIIGVPDLKTAITRGELPLLNKETFSFIAPSADDKRLTEDKFLPELFYEKEPFVFKRSAEAIKAEPSSESSPKLMPTYDIKELRKQFRLPLTQGREYTEPEIAAIPEMDDGYVISDSNYQIAKELYEAYPFLDSLGLAANIMLVGDSGSGKTQSSRFFADVFHRPRTKETLRADTDETTLLGGYYPCFKDLSTWSDLDDADRKVVQRIEEIVRVSSKSALGGAEQVLSAICAAMQDEDVREEVRRAYGVPSIVECLMDPESAWKALGNKDECPPAETVAIAANAKADELQYRLMNILFSKQNEDKVTYRYLESQLLKAFEQGWLLEIQEVATVKNPGVLSILNSLLEPNGTIELPGRVVRRHPDTIVVVTTNVGYEGCRKLNEAFKDRMICCDIMSTPTAEVMSQRILAKLGRAAS